MSLATPPKIQELQRKLLGKAKREPAYRFYPNAHGYRPGHSALQAVREVHQTLKAGYTDVVDADLSKFFDTIPHAELMRSVARRVCDGRMLRLVKMWLKAPIEEDNGQGGRTRRSPGNRGTPQGGVLSPLLANIYMRRFLKAWEQRGYEQKRQARIVNYADDFVILCRHTAAQSLSAARGILTRIGLTLNEEKTRTCHAWREPFDFLGYTFGKVYSPQYGNAYLGVQPSKRRMARLREGIRELTTRSTTWQTPEELVGAINRVLRGWSGYFSYGTLRKAYRAIDRHVSTRVRHWLVRKHKAWGRGSRRFPASYIYDRLGLMSLCDALTAARTPCR